MITPEEFGLYCIEFSLAGIALIGLLGFIDCAINITQRRRNK